jgi:hypothetical protein
MLPKMGLTKEAPSYGKDMEDLTNNLLLFNKDLTISLNAEIKEENNI